MKRPKIKVGDTVRLVDLEDLELRLVTLTVTSVKEPETVYGSVVDTVYTGVAASRGESPGGAEIYFTDDLVVAVNTDHRDAIYYCKKILEDNIRQGYTKLSMTQQTKLLGVLKAYAN